VTVPNFGDYFDPRTLAETAREAESAGWDGFFLWDHVQFMPTPTVDPWMALAASASHRANADRPASDAVAAPTAG
jgi:alkanesulfonate monooxygenase SsuD/methylene tetrahydromethanopterin reductase-like flavin-dependent oxidoreductase (luciferase family)